MTFAAPVSGKIVAVNTDINDRIEYVNMKPYELGWMCSIEPTNLNEDLQSMRVGADTVSWYEKEIDKYHEIARKISREKLQAWTEAEKNDQARSEQLSQEIWTAFSNSFLQVTFE